VDPIEVTNGSGARVGAGRPLMRTDRNEGGPMTSGADEDRAVWAFAEHEHVDLARGIDRIHDVACVVGQIPTPELSARVLNVLRWLNGTLEPHIAWEDRWLFPEIDARTGSPTTTLAARLEHRQIREVIARLRADHDRLDHRGVGDDNNAATCSDLVRLEAMIRAHLRCEERFLFPLLEEGRTPVHASASSSTDGHPSDRREPG
jgi:iron-sulfur cluster repair protein YtfE (RIC family)